MAYFTPLQYSPTPQPHELANLFDVVNKLGVNPMVTGEEFGNAPQYSPFAETRADFTTTKPSWYDSNIDRWHPARDIVDDKGYLDARFGHMNDYLNSLGSFFGGFGSPQTHQILANAPAQGPRPPMPTVGSNLNFGGGIGGTNLNNPFPSFGVGSGGGWGTPPTSLFGAGANATNT
jgi:hypothetical protein